MLLAILLIAGNASAQTAVDFCPANPADSRIYSVTNGVSTGVNDSARIYAYQAGTTNADVLVPSLNLTFGAGANINTNTNALMVDPVRNRLLFIAKPGSGNTQLWAYDAGNGGWYQAAAPFASSDFPRGGMTPDGTGYLVVGGSSQPEVWRVNASGTYGYTVTHAGNLTFSPAPTGNAGSGDIAFDTDGIGWMAVGVDLYELDMTTLVATRQARPLLNGAPSTISWAGIAFGSDGQLYLANNGAGGGYYAYDPEEGTITRMAGTTFSQSRDLASCVFPAPSAAVLSATKALVEVNGAPYVAGSRVYPGDQLTYAITVENTGTAVATLFPGDVAETVPANTTHAGGDGFTCTGTACGNTAAVNVAVGASVTLEFSVLVNDPLPPAVTSIANAVTIAGVDCSQPGNDCNETTPVGSTVTVSKSANPADGSIVNTGDTITYTLTVLVANAATTAPVTLTDTLGAGLTLASASLPTECSAASQVVTCVLAAGATVGSHSFSYEAMVASSATGSVGNSVVATGGGNDPDPVCNSCQTSHLIPALPLQTCTAEQVRASERWWYFGNRGVIDFGLSGDTATSLLNPESIASSEGSTVVSDANGDLLFWTGGTQVDQVTLYNRQQVPMPNGSGLIGNHSAVQMVASFPAPDVPGRYFVVTTTAVAGGMSGSLHYSVVDMSLDGGLGAVLPDQRNIPLGPTGTSSEALTAVPNADGTGYWVLTSSYNSPNVLAYAFDSDGPVTGNPVVSQMSSNNYNGYGTIYINRDMDRLALLSHAHGNPGRSVARILTLDAASGELYELASWATPVSETDPNLGTSGSRTAYAADFSPDSNYLYVSRIYPGTLYRYDISSGDSATIAASEEFVGITGNGTQGGGHIRRAPDGRMYIARQGDGAGSGMISRIDFPDNPTVGNDVAGSIGFALGNFPLASGSVSTWGLPQMVVGCPLGAELDYGDAPDSYGTTMAAGGPAHLLVDYDAAANTAPLMLGSLVDAEFDGYPSSAADGDDLAAPVADEDALVAPVIVDVGATSVNLTVRVTNDTSDPATLYGWIDFDGNGQFDASEFATATVAPGATTVSLSWSGLAPLTSGSTYLRLRLTSADLPAGTAPNGSDARALGEAPDGEVEDHRVEIVPTLTCTSNASVVNTGYDGSGGQLPQGERDPRWSVGLGTDTGGPGSVAAWDAAWVHRHSAWIAPPFSNAQWISYTQDAQHTGDVDYYFVYRFNLAAEVIPSLFALNIDYYADNSIWEVYVNGQAQSGLLSPGTLPQAPTNPYVYQGFVAGTQASVRVANGWQTGLNEIVVQVKSGQPYIGFLAQVASEQLCASDFGDAPASYGTLQADGGPSHLIVGYDLAANTAPLMLGSTVDAEIDGQPSADADGDDTGAPVDDEDAFSAPIVLPLINGGATLSVPVTNTATVPATLYAWVDFNRNGVFDAAEFASAAVPNGATSVELAWTGLDAYTAGSTIARFRLTSDVLAPGTGANGGDARALGAAGDGEVEDHVVVVEKAAFGLAKVLSEVNGAPYVAGTPVYAGDVLTYAITVTNTGDAQGTVLAGELIETVPANTTHAGNDDFTCTGANCGNTDPFTIAAGASATLAFEVEVNDPLPASASTIVNAVSHADVDCSAAGNDCDETTPLGPVVSVVKSSNPGSGATVSPGDVITYTLTVTVANGATTAPVTLTDTLGAGLMLVPGSLPAECSNVGNVVTCILASGAVATNHTFSYQAIVNADATGNVGNSVTAAGGDDPSCPSCETEHPLAPSVTLVKTVADGNGNGQAEPGEALAYTITLTNSGGIAATGYGVTDTLDANTTFVSADNGGTHAAGVVTWTGLTVPAGGSLTLTVGVTVNDPIPAGVEAITNLAHETGTTPPDCSVTPTPEGCASIPTVPAVTLAKTVADEDGNGQAAPGEALTYTITLTNSGGSPATGYGVTDTLDANTTFVSADNGGTHAAGVVSWTGLTVPAGDTLVLTVNVTVNDPIPAGVEAITNLAHETGTTPPDCSVTPTPEGCASIPTVPAVTLAKTVADEDGNGQAAPGEALTYTITLTNSGGSPATGYGVTDTLDANTTFVSADNGGTHAAGVVTWTGLTVPAGDTLVLTVNVTVNDPIPAGVEAITNLAHETGTTPPDCSATPTPEGCAAIPTIPAVTLAKTVADEDGNGHAVPGEALTYTITLTNSGGSPATGYGVTDTLDANTTFVSADNGGTHAAGVVTWTGLTVPAGGSLTLIVEVTVNDPIPAGVVQITNLAHETGGTPPDCSATPTPSGCASLPSAPNLSVTKALSGESIEPDGVAEPGEELTYTITVRNEGGTAAVATIVNETVPEHTTFVGGAPTWTCAAGDPAGTACEALVDVPAATGPSAPGVVTLTFTVAVDDPLADGVDSIANAVAINDGTPPDCAATPSDPACAVTPTINVTLTKSMVSVTPTGPATLRITYLITLTNLGGSDADYTVQDTLDYPSAGVVYTGNATVSTTDGIVNPALPGGAFAPANGVAVQLSDTDVVLPAGASHGYTVVVPIGIQATGLVSGQCDGNPGNGLYNAASVTGSFDLATSTCTPIDDEMPVIRLVKEVALGTDTNGNRLGDVGDVLDYTFTISNPGTLPLMAVQLIDPRVSDLQCATFTANGEPFHVLRGDELFYSQFEIYPRGGALEPGDSVQCTASHTLTAQDVALGRVVNTATASGSATGGRTVSSTSTAIFTQFR